jgi:hypothetical protein
MVANPQRGEIALELGQDHLILRPSFESLCAAEAELGSLFALVERAAQGKLLLSEMISLFWHLQHPAASALSRETFAERASAAGLAALSPILRQVLAQILKGSPCADESTE